jgi:prevent-host-death family protein
MTQRTKAVGMFEAKTRLSALIEEVERGNEITITRRGVPVARLIPTDEARRHNPLEAAAKLRQLRRGIKLGRLTLRRLVEEGRL